MPVVNPLARELVFKVVYYGPGLGGKTTSLQYVHATAKPEHRGKMVSLATPVDRTLYFDFLPIRVPNVRGMSVKLQLFTVPGQVHYNATRKLVLTGADGIVLVYDSQSARADANLETLDNLRDNLSAHGRTLSEMPHIVQYNKRDLHDVLPIDELDRQLNRAGAPSFATVATNGEGVYESLEAITRAVLEDFERRMP
ncbi:MAG TPA: GTPase domain-containing protein, partial [Polyangiaceae bacterium]